MTYSCIYRRGSIESTKEIRYKEDKINMNKKEESKDVKLENLSKNQLISQIKIMKKRLYLSERGSNRCQFFILIPIIFC